MINKTKAIALRGKIVIAFVKTLIGINIMTQQTLEAQLASSNFDALAFENQRQSVFDDSQNPYYEILPYFNQNEGIQYFDITANNSLIGSYHRNPWLETWVGISGEDGYEVEFDSDTEAIAYIKRLYLAAC